MSSVANKDSAEQARQRGQDLLSRGDLEGAAKWVAKSLALFETPEAHALTKAVQEAQTHLTAVRRVLDARDLFEVLGVGRNTIYITKEYNKIALMSCSDETLE